MRKHGVDERRIGWCRVGRPRRLEFDTPCAGREAVVDPLEALAVGAGVQAHVFHVHSDRTPGGVL